MCIDNQMESSVVGNDKSKEINKSATTQSEEQQPIQEQTITPKNDFWIDGRYYVIKFLGEGAFGSVFLVYDDLSGQYLALKMAKNKQHLRVLQDEIRNMQLIDANGDTENKPLIHLFNYSVNRGTMMSTKGDIYSSDITYFVMNFADWGDLATEIIDNCEKYKQGIPESSIFKIFKQLLDGIEWIHQKGFVHLDFKPDNVLILSSQDIAISDFSFLKPIKGEDGKGTIF